MARVIVAVGFAVIALAGPAAAASPTVSWETGLAWGPSNDIVLANSRSIWILSPDGGKPRLLTKKIGHFGLVGLGGVSPDGKTLLYSADVAGEWKLHTIPLAGGSPRNLGLFGYGAEWSPDGKRIAFAGDGGDFIADADGRHAHKFVSNGYPDLTGDPTWSPDGKKLAYVACTAPRGSEACEHQSNFDVYVIDVDGTNRHRLTPKTGFPQCPTWSRRALLAFKDGDTKIVRKEGFRSLGVTSCPTWAPDGRRLVFTRGLAAGGEELVVTRYDGTGRKRIHMLTDDTRSYGDVAWSPDGSRLAFVAGEPSGGSAHLYVVGDDGRGLRRLL